jgi:hypothetical protein
MFFSKRAALPSVSSVRSQSASLDSIHFRVPENWRGKAKSKRVRKWFQRFLDGKISLAPIDPGPGPLELSVRLPRGELKRAAQQFKMPGVSLLRRIIAVQIGCTHPSSVSLRKPGIADQPSAYTQSKSVVPRRSVWPQASSPASQESIARKPLNIVTQVDGYRSLETIGQAIKRGEGITAEELIRWRAVYDGT